LSELAEEVNRTHERLLVTKNGRDYVVVLAAADLESIESTLELLANPAAQARIGQAGREIGRGEDLSEPEIRALLNRPLRR